MQPEETKASDAQPAQPVVSAPPAPPVPPVPSVPPASQAPAPQPAAVPAVAAPQVFGGTIDQPDDFDVDDEEYDDESDEPIDLSTPVNWQAKEYIHQEKDSKWFTIFGIVLVVMMAAAIFLMNSWTFAVLLVVIAGVIIVFAKRPPRMMSYSLSDKGLHVGDTLHSFSDFRAFGVIHDGQEYSIMLIPTKRFLPGITVYFPEESGEQIVDALGSRLPMQDLRLDIIDRIVRTLRLG